MPEPLAALRARAATLREPLYPAFVARAARFDALADPHFFLREQLVELRALLHFRAEQLFFASLVPGKAAGKAREASAVELDHARCHVVEKTPIMRNEQHAAGKTAQQFLEPLDARNIEVIGRLVEQQQFGFGDKSARERDPLLEPAR